MNHTISSVDLLAIYLCCAIGIIVFFVLIYSLIKFRKTKGEPHFHKNLVIEMIWTIIPFLILIGLALPAILEKLLEVS